MGLRASAQDPAGRAYSASPDPVAIFKGPTSKGREEEGERRREGGKEGEGKGGEGSPSWGVWIRQFRALPSYVVRPSVCPSVCNGGELWANRLGYFESNYTNN